jgi:pimeloyl-ACP methyl ester carboxylesterase
VRGLVVLVLLLLAGCGRVTPTPAEVKAGGPLPRPVVVLGGYGDPIGIGSGHLARRLRDLTGDRRVLAIPAGLHRSFDSAADRAVRQVRRRFGDVEVDVVGISMGGLTARHAAAREDDPLRVARLYTVCSPHTGAQAANDWAWADLFLNGRQMRTGSPFLQDLARREGALTYPIVQYARRNDVTIGRGARLPTHLHSRGQVIWLNVPPWRTGHAFCYADERILADIARRLRWDE